MHSVLIVDDEENVLKGIERILRPMRKEWNIFFATGGHQALKNLAEHPVDVIVSDMRMPEMNGVELLNKVKEQYPEIIRIALSGHAETQMELECARAAHQFLSKPARAEELKAAVDRAVSLQKLLKSEEMRALVSGMDSLPSLPALYQKIMEEASSPEGSLRNIGKIVEQDVAMSAKMLQLVNSAFFGFPRHVSSAAEAAAILGMDTVKSLVLVTKVFQHFKDAAGGFDLEQMNRRGQQLSVIAKNIAIDLKMDKKLCDYALMAGMLNDIGKLILAYLVPQRYAGVLAEFRDTGERLWVLEEKEFGVNHANAGAFLLGIWGLPNMVVEAVAYHLCPRQSGTREISPLTAVHIANELMHEFYHGDERSYLDNKYLAELSCQGFIPRWRELVQDVLAEEK